jgi:hypothetical protein
MGYLQDGGKKMNKSKIKGDRFERELVHLAESFGLKAYRNRMSRSPKNESSWDVSIGGAIFEVKKRKNGFKQIEKWFSLGIDGLIIGSDYHEPMVILRFKDYLKLR